MIMKDKEKDYLEDFVHQNRKAFDSFEPPADMFNRISNELDKKNSKKIRPLYYIQRVAAVAVILLAGYGLVRLGSDLTPNSVNKKEKHVHATETEPVNVLGETMLYYVTQVNNKRQALEEKAAQYPEISSEIKEEFNALDAEFKDLENDLKENVSNATVLEAMINTARIKLEILEEMQQELTKLEHKENTHHEIHTEL